MIHQTASISIASPVSEVYNFMSEPSNRLRYDAGLIAVRVTPDGPLRIGSKIVEVRPFMGMKREMATEVCELEPDQVIGYRTLPGDSLNASGSYRFASAPAGALLTLDFRIDPKGLMKLAAAFIAADLRRSIPAGLSAIKAVLEKPP